MPEFTIVLKDAIDRMPAEGYTRDSWLGLDTYPIFDTAYRAGLNQKIVDHFWNQEIGLETIELFRFAVRRKMNEVMPMYNQFYQSQLLDVDPFLTFDSTTTTENTTVSVATNSSTADSKGRAVSSEFPQNQLSANGDYATSATDNVGNAVNAAEANSNDESTGSVNTKGFSGAMADLLLRYRETFLNIDLQIITELQECFMLVCSNNDETFPRQTYGYIGWF